MIYPVKMKYSLSFPFPPLSPSLLEEKFGDNNVYIFFCC